MEIEKPQISDELNNKNKNIFVEFLLLPWIIIWGWYIILGIFLFIFNNRSNRFSVELDFFNFQTLEQSIPLAVTRIVIISAALSLGSFICSHFLRVSYPKVNNFFFVLNLLNVLFISFLILPVISSLLI